MEKQEQCNSNISASEVDSETLKKLKGDAIGDTTYSEVFVLNTLLSLSNLKWNKKTEKDLCSLWDMTDERDVSKYLMENNFVSLVNEILYKYSDNNRFVEIIIGILANILCFYNKVHLNDEDINCVLKFLNSDDPLILTQIMRFLHVLSFNTDCSLKFIDNEIMKIFYNILGNSTNVDLLVNTLKILSSFTNDFKLDSKFINSDTIKHITIAFRTITTDYDEYCALDLLESRIAIKHYIEIICYICAYIENGKIENFDFKDDVKNDCIDTLIYIMDYYSSQDNLLPLNDDFKFYLQAILFIIQTLSLEYKKSLFIDFYKMIIIMLKECHINECEDVIEIFCYFISKYDENILIKDLKDNCENLYDVKKVINFLDDNKKDYDFNFSYEKNLKKLKLLFNN